MGREEQKSMPLTQVEEESRVRVTDEALLLLSGLTSKVAVASFFGGKTEINLVLSSGKLESNIG